MGKLIVKRNMSQTRITDVGKLTWEREGQRCCWQTHSRRRRSLKIEEGKASLTLVVQTLAGNIGWCCGGQTAEQGAAVAGPGQARSGVSYADPPAPS